MASTVFSQAPLASLIVCVIAAAIVCRRSATLSAGRVRSTLTVARSLLLIAAAAVAVEHLLLLIAPQAVLRWNADVRRLLALEALGAVAGCVCVAAALVALWRQLLNETPDRKSIPRTLNVSVASVVMVSGVAIAVAYRWASSWSVVTLTPYLWSLSSAQPRIDLVASTPFLVRLHVLAGFASLALLPFADTFAAVAAAVSRSVHASATRLARARLARTHLTVAAAAGVRSKAVWFKGGR